MGDQILGRDTDVEAALAAADVDDVEHGGDLVDHRRQAPLLAERADATADVAGDPFGDRRVAHLGSLGAEGPTDGFQSELAADRHDRDRLVTVSGDEQGLEHLVGIETELGSRLHPEVVVVASVVVLVEGVGNRGSVEFVDRRGHIVEYGRAPAMVVDDRRVSRCCSNETEPVERVAARRSTVAEVRISVDPSLDPGSYGYVHRLRVRFAETDAMGIVHHSRYLPMLEEARVAYLRHIGHPYAEIRAEGVDMSVLEAWCQYRRPLRFDDVVDVHVVVAAVERASFQMSYLLTVHGEVHATGVTAHGCVTSDGRPTRLPAWLRDLDV